MAEDALLLRRAAAGDKAEDEDAPAAPAAAAAIAARCAVSTAANNEAALTIARSLHSLTSAVTAINPVATAALRDAAPPGMLLALKALGDSTAEVLRVATEGRAGGGLLQLAGAAPPGGAPPPLPTALPVPTSWYPPGSKRAVRLCWKAYYLLWTEGIRAGFDGEGDSPFPAGRCPPLRLSAEPGNLTWERSGKAAGQLSKAALLGRLLLAVVAYEEKTAPRDAAIGAAAQRFTAAWGSSKEDALRGARKYFQGEYSREYMGEDLSTHFEKVKVLKRKADGEPQAAQQRKRKAGAAAEGSAGEEEGEAE